MTAPCLNFQIMQKKKPRSCKYCLKSRNCLYCNIIVHLVECIFLIVLVFFFYKKFNYSSNLQHLFFNINATALIMCAEKVLVIVQQCECIFHNFFTKISFSEISLRFFFRSRCGSKIGEQNIREWRSVMNWSRKINPEVPKTMNVKRIMGTWMWPTALMTKVTMMKILKANL